MKNDFDNVTEFFDEEESRKHFEEREILLNERRAKAKKTQELKRKLYILGGGVIALAFVVLIIVFSIKGIVKHINNKKIEEVNITTQNEVVDKPTLTPKPTPSLAPSYLGYNETVDANEPMAGDIKLFSGYTVNKTDNTFYIERENMTSQYAILVDGQTGDVVCEREGFTRISPASMTKVLTVLVAAENLTDADLDKEVIITEEDHGYAYKNNLSQVGFEIGEKVKVKDLFYGTILPSGADAALALAKYVSGDVDTFIELMNEKINELGLHNTHFTNCVGSFDEDHYSTCADMAIILKAAVENKFCYEVLKEHKYTTLMTLEHPDGIEISNWFLRRIEDKDTGGEVICAKTGFVNESGNCAVSYYVSNDKHPYFCVTAQTWSAWRCIYDHVDIYYNETGIG